MHRALVALGAYAALTPIAAACEPPSYLDQAREDSKAALQADYPPRIAFLPAAEEGGPRPQAFESLCTLVVNALAASADGLDRWAVASEQKGMAIALIRCIAAATSGSEYPRLHLVFVGDPDDETEARERVEGMEAEFFFVSDRAYGVPPASYSALTDSASATTRCATPAT
jgi:hypothetical protein